jgi:hypothetical protein
MGLGMFPSRDINKGDLIYAERPLVVVPKSRLSMFSDIHFLQPVFERLTPGNQAAYSALANIQTQDGSRPLYGVARTNGYCIELGERSILSFTSISLE